MNRPIIFKVLTTFDKELIHQNIAKLKKFNEDRDSTVFVIDHLPKEGIITRVSRCQT